MVSLPDGESLKMCLLVSKQYTSVTDGRTDGWHDAGIASRGKNQIKWK